MANIAFVKKYGQLMPATPQDAELVANWKEGGVFHADFKRKRNGQFHRKFFAMIAVVVENTDYDNSDQVLHLLKLKLGHYENIINTNNDVVYAPKSISFAKMDEDSFNQFYNQAVNKVLSDFLPKWQENDMENAVNRILEFC